MSKDPKEVQNIWFPGRYQGREGDYAQKISECDIDEVVRLVVARAQEDEAWLLANGFKEPIHIEALRRKTRFVMDGKNIQQCVDYVQTKGEDPTVDWVCRELAKAAKVMVR
jgi:hypothetical protein